MKEPTWINLRFLKAFHDQQINEHGGLPGLRDEGLLLSALSRPEYAYHYYEPESNVIEDLASGAVSEESFRNCLERARLKPNDINYLGFL